LNIDVLYTERSTDILYVQSYPSYTTLTKQNATPQHHIRIHTSTHTVLTPAQNRLPVRTDTPYIQPVHTTRTCTQYLHIVRTLAEHFFSETLSLPQGLHGQGGTGVLFRSIQGGGQGQGGGCGVVVFVVDIVSILIVIVVVMYVLVVIIVTTIIAVNIAIITIIIVNTISFISDQHI
jgi:hypothetical protein